MKQTFLLDAIRVNIYIYMYIYIPKAVDLEWIIIKIKDKT